ncbi:MAG: recombination-associated protein RdgC [Kiritimatiellia bacterium]
MAFDQGAVNFRLFYMQNTLKPDILTEFAEHAAPPVSTLSKDPISGWVTGRHLLDRQITDEKCMFGPYLYTTLMKAERKVPEALLKAHCKLEEEVELKARSVEFLPRKVRAEIKQRVIDSLLPKMPPTLTGIPTVIDFSRNLLLAGAMSDKQIDALTPYFKQTTETQPILLTPDTAALKRKRLNHNDLSLTSFSPDKTIEPPPSSTLGMDFLTWLWFDWEKNGGIHKNLKGEEFGYMLEGPLTFFREGEGAHEALLRKGMPLNSREAMTALLCGKKLKKVKFVLAHQEKVYSAAVDAEFAFRSMKLPKIEQMESSGIFTERMRLIEIFLDDWFALFDRFLELRSNTSAWNDTVNAVRIWIDKRVKEVH